MNWTAIVYALLLQTGHFSMPFTAPGISSVETLQLVPMSLVISGPNGRMAITIRATGQVEFGEGITPNEATKLFVQEMEKMGMKFGCAPEKKAKGWEK